MKKLSVGRLAVIIPLGAVAVLALWAAQTPASTPAIASWVTTGTFARCNVDFTSIHNIDFPTTGPFTTLGQTDSPELVIEVGPTSINGQGLKVADLYVRQIAGHGIAEGLGNTYFWLDTSRPVVSTLQQKTTASEFPAIEEVRFHFLFRADALPGQTFRSRNPAVMRSDNVGAFPPPPGTIFNLKNAVDLEDVANPGTTAGRVTGNRVVVPAAG
ncbi:MAG: hypothetical protein U0002_21530 [Thermoanaerobaculia bacterium]